MLLKLFYVSFLVLILAQAKKETKQQNLDIRANSDQNPPQVPSNCDGNLLNLHVGDINLTQENYDKFKKANQVFILGLSDSNCPQCCFTEQILNSLRQDFQTGKYKYKKNKIQIARLDSSKKYAFMDKDGMRVDSVPSILIYFEGDYIVYEGPKDNPLFLLHFLNKLINPILTLTTDDQIQSFLDLEKEPLENIKFFGNQSTSLLLGKNYSDRITKTRVLAFIYDKEEYREELKNLRLAGRMSAKRDELRIGLVTDKKLIKKYKSKNGNLWFPEVGYSTVILKRYDGQIFFYDFIADKTVNLLYWITKKSIKDVEEMNPDTFKIFEIIRQPIVVAFVDFKKSNDKKVFKESSNLVDKVFKELAPKYYNGLIFAYADNDIYRNHRKLLGITHSLVPAISINNNEQKVVPYPQDGEQTVEAIDAWLLKFVKGELKAKDQNFGEVIDVDIKYMIQNTVQLKRRQFREKIYEEGTDCFVYFYTTAHEDETQRMVAQKVNELAQKFTQQGIKSVLIATYDVNTENYAPRVDQQDVPMILFFPAYHKNPPYMRYLGVPKVSEMANFIQKHADIKFEIGIDLAQQEQIQEMRFKQMREEEERKQQMKMIEDELKKRGEL